MSLSHRILVVVVAGSLAACGAAPAEPEPAAETAGGEVVDVLHDDEPTEPDEPVVLRSTIPVPVPQPAVRRERLSPALQAVWTHVEEQVAIRRPAGPDEVTIASVQEWANGPFRAWIGERRAQLELARDLLAAVPEDPPHERAVALALFAYAFEDFGAQIAGSPVPDDIARDEELRGIYIRSLNEAIVPLGERAIELYADCQRRLVVLGDDSPWLPWRAYCVQRGQEIISGYGLAPAASPAP